LIAAVGTPAALAQNPALAHGVATCEGEIVARTLAEAE